MPENFENIGLFYQKYYFRGINFDSQGNYKKEYSNTIKDRNQTLLNFRKIIKEYFYSSSGDQLIKLKSVYPGIITGIGMKHETAIEGEFKLGMYFDYTSGMPCIPGASVKGALRAAFPQFHLHKDTGKEIKMAKSLILSPMINEVKPGLIPIMQKKASNCSNEDFYTITEIEEEIFDGKNFDEKRHDEKGQMKKMLSVYEKDIFHDAYIIQGDSKGRLLADDAITNHPHPLKNPVPVMFMKIISGVKVLFNFDLKDGKHLTAKQKRDLLRKVLIYYGIGAKTNVGYGQFEPV